MNAVAADTAGCTCPALSAGWEPEPLTESVRGLVHKLNDTVVPCLAYGPHNATLRVLQQHTSSCRPCWQQLNLPRSAGASAGRILAGVSVTSLDCRQPAVIQLATSIMDAATTWAATTWNPTSPVSLALAISNTTSFCLLVAADDSSGQPLTACSVPSGWPRKTHLSEGGCAIPPCTLL
jgi:hypothetical protein